MPLYPAAEKRSKFTTPFSSLVYFLQNAKESRQFLSDGGSKDHVHLVLHVAATKEYGKSGRLKCRGTFFHSGISRIGTFFANAANAANAVNTRRGIARVTKSCSSKSIPRSWVALRYWIFRSIRSLRTYTCTIQLV